MIVRHILVDHEYEADDVIYKLKSGEDFLVLASKFSKCSSASQGGLLPEITPGRMVQEFEEAAMDLQVGQTSAPVRTQFGYHIIKRES